MVDELFVALLVIFLILYFKISLIPSIVLLLVLIFVSSFAIYIFLPQFKQPVTGVEGMNGMKGYALEILDPHGKVSLKGEIWDAQSIDGRIEKGEEIIVQEVKNLRVIVVHSKK
jgi:membrane-bound serine protease (ClpP class)